MHIIFWSCASFPGPADLPRVEDSTTGQGPALLPGESSRTPKRNCVDDWRADQARDEDGECRQSKLTRCQDAQKKVCDRADSCNEYREKRAGSHEASDRAHSPSVHMSECRHPGKRPMGDTRAPVNCHEVHRLVRIMYIMVNTTFLAMPGIPLIEQRDSDRISRRPHPRFAVRRRCARAPRAAPA